LIVGLLLLLIMTLISAAAMQSTILEERMAGNQRNINIAFQAAEGALRQGELDLRTDKYFDSTHDDFWSNTNWATADSEETPDIDGLYEPEEGALTTVVNPGEEDRFAFQLPGGTISGVASQPKYFLERIEGVPMPKSSLVQGFGSETPTITFYRVNARGMGMTDKAIVVLQSTFYR